MASKKIIRVDLEIDENNFFAPKEEIASLPGTSDAVGRFMITANCRNMLSAEDFDFVWRTLSRSRESAVSLAELLCDADARDAILDHEKLVSAILSSDGTLRISPQLYFYILTRHVLKCAGVLNRDICDYIASMLTAFSRTAQMTSPDGAIRTEYLSDLLLALRGASPRQAFLIRAHIGNYSLFITGIFPERIEERSRHGAPDVSFYERLGRTSYRTVASDAVAKRCHLDGVYEELAERFGEVRQALNRLSEELITLDEPSIPNGAFSA